MNNTRGNLYWEIEFTGLYNGAEDCNTCEETHVSVEGHDFADAYNKAEAMYAALLKTHPDKVYCAHVYLRDDRSVSPCNDRGIYVTHYISDENVTAFFSVGADRCLRLTWRP